MSEEGKQVKTQVFTLGEIILKLEMPAGAARLIGLTITTRAKNGVQSAKI